MKENVECIKGDFVEIGNGNAKKNNDTYMNDEDKKDKNEYSKNNKSSNKTNFKNKNSLKENNKSDLNNNNGITKCNSGENKIIKNKNEPKKNCDEMKEEKNKSVGKINTYSGKEVKKKKEMNKEYPKDNLKKNFSEKKNELSNKGSNSELTTESNNTNKKNLNEVNMNENNIRNNNMNDNKSNEINCNENSINKNHLDQESKTNSKKETEENNKNENYLQNSWAFLFDRENRKCYEQYINSLISLETFNTIERFYKNYKYMKSPSSIKEYYNIYLFKQNFKPLYEEYPNGFICIIKNVNYFRNNVADLTWEKMVLLTIGEEFNLNDLSGIQLCIRESEIFFKIWMKNYSHYLKSTLTRRLNELLDLPSNTSIIIKILSHVSYSRKNYNLKEKNEKGKKVYNKNKASEYSSKKDSFKIKNYNNISPPNYIGNYNIYKNSLDTNFYYLYGNQNMQNPYLFYPLNIYNQQFNNYSDFLYDYNLNYPIENLNHPLENEINMENNFISNQTNGIILDKKNKFDYAIKNEDNKKNFTYSNNSNEILEENKNSFIKISNTDDNNKKKIK